MDLQQAFLSQMGILTALILIVCAMYKVFQMSAELSQIKDILSDIRRNTQDNMPAARSQAPFVPGQLT